MQGEIERALAAIVGAPVRVYGAGRTDAGVHAAGQVASFTTESRLAEDVLVRALNAHLPPSIVALAVREVPDGFHARYSALSRAYRYTILHRPMRSPLLRRTALHVTSALDAAAMDTAAAALVGTHDFAAFAGASGDRREDASTTRTVLRASCERQGDLLYLDIAANAFLPHMVRNIVGTLVLVGRGALQPEALGSILSKRDRSRAGPTAPPHGLCLVRVHYGDPEL